MEQSRRTGKGTKKEEVRDGHYKLDQLCFELFRITIGLIRFRFCSQFRFVCKSVCLWALCRSFPIRKWKTKSIKLDITTDKNYCRCLLVSLWQPLCGWLGVQANSTLVGLLVLSLQSSREVSIELCASHVHRMTNSPPAGAAGLW